jgi:hypothetical protein
LIFVKNVRKLAKVSLNGASLTSHFLTVGYA